MLRYFVSFTFQQSCLTMVHLAVVECDLTNLVKMLNWEAGFNLWGDLILVAIELLKLGSGF